MNIIHLSDLHLTSDKSPIWRVNTNAQFIKALEKIRQMSNIDCIIVTGDMMGKRRHIFMLIKSSKRLALKPFGVMEIMIVLIR